MKKWVIYTLFAVNLVAVVLLALWTYGWIGDYEKEEIQSRGTPPQVVDIGSGPNTGTGDPLRTAFNKININFSAVYDSLEKWTGLIGPGGSMAWPASAGIPLYTGSQSWGTSITDNSSHWNTAYGWGDHSLANYINSITATSIAEGVLDNAIDDAPIGVAVEDVVGGTTGRNRYMSPAQIENYVALHGGGGGLFSGLERVEFDVGDNFAPNDTETEFQHNVFTDKQVTLFRNKELSEFSYITGGIAVDPAFSTGEHVEIWLWPQGTWTTIGLGSTQDELLDGLGGFWRCEQNPASGITDEMGNHNLTTGSPAATLATGEGIYGNAVKIEHKELLRSSEYNQNIMPHGNAFAFSMWFNLDSLPSERGAPGVTPPPGRNAYLLNAVHSAATPSWNPQYAYIDRENETIYFRVQYVDGETSSYTDIKSNIAVEKEKWYHVVLNCPGAGEYLEIWLDGVNVSSAPNRRFQGVLAEATAALVIGRSNSTANWSLVGMVDDIMMYPSRALSEKEIISLFAKGRGFDFDLE